MSVERDELGRFLESGSLVFSLLRKISRGELSVSDSLRPDDVDSYFRTQLSEPRMLNNWKVDSSPYSFGDRFEDEKFVLEYAFKVRDLHYRHSYTSENDDLLDKTYSALDVSRIVCEVWRSAFLEKSKIGALVKMVDLGLFLRTCNLETFGKRINHLNVDLSEMNGIMIAFLIDDQRDSLGFPLLRKANYLFYCNTVEAILFPLLYDECGFADKYWDVLKKVFFSDDDSMAEVDFYSFFSDLIEGEGL